MLKGTMLQLNPIQIVPFSILRPSKNHQNHPFSRNTTISAYSSNYCHNFHVKNKSINQYINQKVQKSDEAILTQVYVKLVLVNNLHKPFWSSLFVFVASNLWSHKQWSTPYITPLVMDKRPMIRKDLRVPTVPISRPPTKLPLPRPEKWGIWKFFLDIRILGKLTLFF